LKLAPQRPGSCSNRQSPILALEMTGILPGEELLRGLFESAPDAVVVVDSQGRIVLANAQTESLFGYRREELIGQAIEALVPERLRSRHADNRRAYAGHPSVRPMGVGLDLWARRRDETEFPVEISLSPLHMSGEVLISAAIRDITERKQAEQALRDAREQLELRVAERTRELAEINRALRAEIAERSRAEAALVQAQKMEAVGQLTGGIAHDFNNLLTVISGNLQMLRERLTHDPVLVKLVDAAAKSAERGAELIQKLLAFSRRQPLQAKEINLNQIVAGMSDMLRRTLGESIAIKTSLAASLGSALADPGQVENALLNLALNSRDAMPGGGKLTIETAEVAFDDAHARGADVAPGHYLLLAVSDSGIGMPPEVLSRVFEPHFTTKKAGKGTGLGLPMVYGFAKQSGGHVKIYSELGHGTTVKLYLPKAKSMVEELPAEREHECGPLLGRETVLVVEDDEAVRELAVAFLADFGYRLVEAQDGSAAFAVLSTDAAIDLLFTDVVMPGSIDGPELARQAKRLRPELKVLFTSGYAEDALVHHGKLDEGVELIIKPYTKNALARKIRSLLDAR
jgi:PAS domain S-box-containing protein